MPKENAFEPIYNVANIRPRADGSKPTATSASAGPAAGTGVPGTGAVAGVTGSGLKAINKWVKKGGEVHLKEVRKAAVHVADADDDAIPDL